MSNLIRIYPALLLIMYFTVISCSTVSAQQREEFNGPLAGWANVKSRFGAKGDGRADDTRALQKALDNLTCTLSKFNTGKDAYTVIYLPRGRYKITQTLLLRGKIGFNIIGEDPENTIIEWAGKANDTMFWSNASAYFKIARITFQGNNIAKLEGIGIHWKDNWKTATSRSFASVNIEIADCNFKGLSVGIGGGYKMNDSEVKINRCAFYNCGTAGLEIKSANALDYWIWHCRFYDCNVGVSNTRGNYHLYYSYFRNSKTSDVLNDQGYYSSIRGCFSEGSTAFSVDKGSSSNPFKRVFQDNIVKGMRNLPVEYYHTGKPTFYGNRFDKTVSDDNKTALVSKGAKIAASQMPGVINFGSWFRTNISVLSIHNQFYSSRPFLAPSQPDNKQYDYGNKYGKRVDDRSSDFLRKLPTTSRYVKRLVLEVPANADATEIQKFIDRAAQMKGQRPVVHFPYGTYKLNRTINIPAGCDMQLVGDGLRYSTTLTYTNDFQGSALFRVAGPTYVEIRDMQLGTASPRRLTAILFTNIDQQGSMVHMDQLYSKSETSLLVDRIDYTVFEKNNSFYSDGNVIIGGDQQKAGKGTTVVHCFGGQYSRVNVSNNAQFVSKDCWWEGSTRIPVDLHGDGLVTIDGTKIAPQQKDSMPIVRIGKFKGKISLMNTYVQGGIEIAPNNPDLKFFLWNANFYHKKAILQTIPSNVNGQVAYAGITSQCFYKNDPSCKRMTSYPDKFVNIRDENQFVNEMTEQGREAIPVPYINLPSGITNIYLSRVALESFVTGVKFTN